MRRATMLLCAAVIASGCSQTTHLHLARGYERLRTPSGKRTSKADSQHATVLAALPPKDCDGAKIKAVQPLGLLHACCVGGGAGDTRGAGKNDHVGAARTRRCEFAHVERADLHRGRRRQHRQLQSDPRTATEGRRRVGRRRRRCSTERSQSMAVRARLVDRVYDDWFSRHHDRRRAGDGGAR